MMLIFMQENDVFWLLITVVERLLPEDYYTKSMVGTYVDQYVLAHIIKKCLPKVHRYIKRTNVVEICVTSQPLTTFIFLLYTSPLLLIWTFSQYV